ncbi:hypothetical protein ACULNC_22745 [Shigella flexneri]
MGEKTDDAGRDNVKNERYGVAPSVAFGLGTANRLYLNSTAGHSAQHARRRHSDHRFAGHPPRLRERRP